MKPFENRDAKSSGCQDFLLSLLQRISHELRTPLNGVMGFAQLLNASPDAQNLSFYGTQIVKNCQQLNTNLERILQFYRRLSTKTVNSSTIRVEKIQQELSAYPGSCGYQSQFSQFTEASLLSCEVPEDYYYIIIELLDNAIKHSHADEIHCSLTRKGGNLCIQVSDNGISANINLPSVEESTLWQFMDNIGRTENGGTGLGLFSVYWLCKKHQGQMQLLSNLNEGLKAVLNFPLPEQAQQTSNN